jgi:bifunctional non-homologous end joining protein LigD
MMVRRDPAGVRLLTRNGNSWTDRYPLIAEAAGALRARSFLLDGEAVAVDRDGMPSFDRLRYRRADGAGCCSPSTCLELDGRDLRREPIEVRKATIGSTRIGSKSSWVSLRGKHTIYIRSLIPHPPTAERLLLV